MYMRILLNSFFFVGMLSLISVSVGECVAIALSIVTAHWHTCTHVGGMCEHAVCVYMYVVCCVCVALHPLIGCIHVHVHGRVCRVC